MEGLIITILMFSVPIFAAIIDRRLKAARKSRPLVHAEPVIFDESEDEEEEAPAQSIVKDVPSDPMKSTRTAPAANPWVEVAVAKKPEKEPVKTHIIHPEAAAKDRSQRRGRLQEKKEPQDWPTAEEIRKDRRKLILYKEIMTPKFDTE